MRYRLLMLGRAKVGTERTKVESAALVFMVVVVVGL